LEPEQNRLLIRDRRRTLNDGNCRRQQRIVELLQIGNIQRCASLADCLVGGEDHLGDLRLLIGVEQRRSGDDFEVAVDDRAAGLELLLDGGQRVAGGQHCKTSGQGEACRDEQHTFHGGSFGVVPRARRWVTAARRAARFASTQRARRARYTRRASQRQSP